MTKFPTPAWISLCAIAGIMATELIQIPDASAVAGGWSSSAALLKQFGADLSELDGVPLAVALLGTHSLQVSYDVRPLQLHDSIENGFFVACYVNGSLKQRHENEEGYFHISQVRDGALEIAVTVETLTETPELIAIGNATFDWKFEGLSAVNGGGIVDGFMKRSHWKLFPKSDSRRVPVARQTHSNTQSHSRVWVSYPREGETLRHRVQHLLVAGIKSDETDLDLWLYIDGAFAMRTGTLTHRPTSFILPILSDGEHSILLQLHSPSHPASINSLLAEYILKFETRMREGGEINTGVSAEEEVREMVTIERGKGEDNIVTVIWCMTAVPWESDWIAHLLSNFRIQSVTDPFLSTLAPNSILVISENEERNANPGRLLSYLASFRRRGFSVGLIHLSDEIYSADLHFYFAVDFVIRMYWSPLIDELAYLLPLAVVPLGYKTGYATAIRAAGPPLSSSRRKYTWCFVGQASSKKGRIQMLQNARKIGGGFERLTGRWNDAGGMGTEEYSDVLRQCQVTLCPNGNESPETFRIYEALEAGSIPVVTSDPYFLNLFGSDHPLLTVDRDWENLENILSQEREGDGGLERRQRQTAEWWRAKKSSLLSSLSSLISSNFKL